jgi:hypothetical protein
MWEGSLDVARVAIKGFYGKDVIENMKAVSIQPPHEVRSQMKLTDNLETGTDVDETIPSKHPTVPWRGRNAHLYFPCL